MKRLIAFRLSGARAAGRLALVWALAQGGFMIPARAQPAARPDLTGRIVLPPTAAGVPKVMVFGASPKGGGALSLAYPDCAKSARPDADGQFKIPSLDPELKFRLLIVAPGCKPQLVEGLDPATGPFTSYLEAADTNLTTTNSVRGLVLDGRGAPVADALLRLTGVRRDDRSSQSGTPRAGYPIAVTDAQGQFVLSANDPYPGHPRAHLLEVTAEIEARGFVKQKTTNQVGVAATKIVLAEGGGTIEGTVLLPDGRPAEGAFVALKKSQQSLSPCAGVNYKAMRMTPLPPPMPPAISSCRATRTPPRFSPPTPPAWGRLRRTAPSIPAGRATSSCNRGGGSKEHFGSAAGLAPMK